MTQVTEQAKGPGRKLGLFAAVALVMGNMIGSGVFLLPASLAPFGWNAVGAWILTSGGAMVLAYLLARLTKDIPENDDLNAVVTMAFGKLPGFLVSWIYLVSIWVGVPTVAIAGISYLSSLVPTLTAAPNGPVLAALAMLWLVALVNLKSVHAAGNLQIVTLLIKLLPLLLVAGLAVWAIATGRGQVAPFQPASISLSEVSGAATLTLWALLGFETASVAANQVRDPEVNVPRATLWGTGLTGLLYLLVSSAIALMLPRELVGSSPAPFATFVEHFWAAGPVALVAICAVISCLGAANGNTLLMGELPRTMALLGTLPRWFAGTASNGTPRRALFVSTIIGSIFLVLNASKSMQGIFEFLLLLATSAALWLYLGVALAALRLRIARPAAALGAVYSVWTLWGAGIEASGWSLVLMLAGLPIYWWARLDNRLAKQTL